jgi:hypothetical protein
MRISRLADKFAILTAIPVTTDLQIRCNTR